MKIEDIINKFNINLILDTDLLSLDVEGTYDDYQIIESEKGKPMYIIYGNNSSVRITPNRESPIMVHYLFEDDESRLGDAKFYNEKGKLIATEVAIRKFDGDA